LKPIEQTRILSDYHNTLAQFITTQKLSGFWQRCRLEAEQSLTPLLSFRPTVQQCVSEVLSPSPGVLSPAPGGSATTTATTPPFSDAASLRFLMCLASEPDTLSMAVYYIRHLFTIVNPNNTEQWQSVMVPVFQESHRLLESPVFVRVTDQTPWKELPALMEQARILLQPYATVA
jgi:hypothetical protein